MGEGFIVGEGARVVGLGFRVPHLSPIVPTQCKRKLKSRYFLQQYLATRLLCPIFRHKLGQPQYLFNETDQFGVWMFGCHLM